MRNSHTLRASLALFASAALLPLAACSDGEEAVIEGEATEFSNDTVAALVSNAEGLSQVEELMEAAGMTEVFDNAAEYTIFAPTDDALAQLGEEFEGADATPALVAILREHIVPGYLTTPDIAAAIESTGGPVEMATMGSGTLTFSLDGETVMVTAGGGGNSAAVMGGMLGANGVVIPIDSVLKDVSAN